jgi:hypothetical protein
VPQHSLSSKQALPSPAQLGPPSAKCVIGCSPMQIWLPLWPLQTPLQQTAESAQL